MTKQLTFQGFQNNLVQDKKHLLGQFNTPPSVGEFMASLFSPTNLQVARLLDAGAGTGTLTKSFLKRWRSGDLKFSKVEVTAYEIDETLRNQLSRNLVVYTSNPDLEVHFLKNDFIEHSVKMLQSGPAAKYTHAILNPPYKKINSGSTHRLLLRKVGIETVNLYSAFVALAVASMDINGQIVAIIPRSFCNGPYYRQFRELILSRTAIHHIHLFGARDKAFRQDDVLQENIIILLESGGHQGDVVISTSTDELFNDYYSFTQPFDQIVFPDDTEKFIHIPTSPDHKSFDLSKSFRYSLKDIGVEVSTGPVVDFRVKSYCRQNPEAGTVPLLYPGHFKDQSVKWPRQDFDKPNAIMINSETKKWLYPTGFYAVVRRFSSKEEKRRLMASVVTPTVSHSEFLGFENHLNVFHQAKHGLTEELARGLSLYLNSTDIDNYFRRFSGHTQVNATDLRAMKYPSQDALFNLGKWAMDQSRNLNQEQVDEQIRRIL